MFEPYWRYLGLAIRVEGRQRFFVFTCLTFGVDDAALALTKLLRFPLQRWREWGARAFLHLDDGIGAVRGRKKAQELSDRVKADLAMFGLLTSDEKCVWKVTQVMEWTGWIINTEHFKIYVPERKILKAEGMLELLLAKVGKAVKVRELSSMVGLIISFGLAVGRFAMMAVARMVEEDWSASLLLFKEVVAELRYWEKNPRRLNGQPIRKMVEVQVVRPVGPVPLLQQPAAVQFRHQEL